jgi:hypothetical protein
MSTSEMMWRSDGACVLLLRLFHLYETRHTTPTPSLQRCWTVSDNETDLENVQAHSGARISSLDNDPSPE